MIRFQIIVPPLGDRSKNCKLVRWCYPDGALVEKGAHVATVETKKATMDLEAECEGLLRYGVREGERVEFHTSIGVVENDGLERCGDDFRLTTKITAQDLALIDRERDSLSRDEFLLECLRKRLAEKETSSNL